MRDRLLQTAKPLVEKFPSLAHRYRIWRDGRWKLAEPQMTPFGFRLTGHAAMAGGDFEPVETALVGRLLDRAELFINIGANIGYYVCHALHRGCAVVAVEPLRTNLDYLMRNIRANGGADRVEILPVAVSDSAGIVELFGAGTGASLVPGWAGAPVSGGQLTPVMRIDAVIGARFAGRRCLVLMDVEGVEDRALAGAALLLDQQPRPVWLVEISFGEHLGHSNPLVASTFARFFDRGYRAWTATDPVLPVTCEAVEAAAAAGTNPFGTHNFVFADHDPFAVESPIPPQSAD